MNKYHKIQTVFKRNPQNNYKTLLEDEYSLPEFKYLKDNKWIFTEKVDGTNIRIIFDKEKILIKGKGEKSQIPKFLGEALKEIFLPKLELFKQEFTEPVCFYGEGYGAKIQKIGGNYRPDQGFVLFDIKINNYWLKREDIETIGKLFHLDIVPIIGIGTLDDLVKLCKRGFYSQWGNFLAEGIVARPKIELQNRNGGRIITKLKYNDFQSTN